MTQSHDSAFGGLFKNLNSVQIQIDYHHFKIILSKTLKKKSFKTMA